MSKWGEDVQMSKCADEEDLVDEEMSKLANGERCADKKILAAMLSPTCGGARRVGVVERN